MYSFFYDNKKIHFHYVKDDHIAKAWKNNGFYEKRLLEKIKSLNLDGVYVDLGSHHGNHSIYFDKFCNSDKVISIEGNPFNFNYLKKNLSENKCESICYNVAISNKIDQVLTFHYRMPNTGGSVIINNQPADLYELSFFPCKATNKSNTLDNLLKDEENISLIKIDCENYEYYCLLGSQNIITKHKPVIIIELHSFNPYYNEILDFLNKNNYKTDGISYAGSPTYIYKCSDRTTYI